MLLTGHYHSTKFSEKSSYFYNWLSICHLRAGITEVALEWFRSYLFNRHSSVSIAGCVSSTTNVSYGVPQGSILGPILFSIYMLPLGDIIRKYNVNFHCYADDTQLYIPIKPGDQSNITALHNCITEIKY